MTTLKTNESVSIWSLTKLNFTYRVDQTTTSILIVKKEPSLS